MTDTSASSFPSADAANEATSGPRTGSTLRVASWNIFSSKVMGNGPDNAGLRRALTSLRADVYGLQEVDAGMFRTRWRNLAADAAFAVGGEHCFVNARRRMDGGYYGNAIVSSPAVVLGKATTLRLPRHGWRAERRVAALTTVVKDGRTWVFATAHLSNTRTESEDQLGFLLRALNETDGPAVITGDFNRRPHEVISLVHEAGWRVVESGPTYPSGGPQQRIDYVLYRSCELIGEHEVHSLPVSDHCALTAEFTDEV